MRCRDGESESDLKVCLDTPECLLEFPELFLEVLKLSEERLRREVNIRPTLGALDVTMTPYPPNRLFGPVTTLGVRTRNRHNAFV